MFLSLSPAPQLASLVHAYWFIEDLPGVHEGIPIRTCPAPTAALTVNIGRPNAAEDGSLVPGVSLLGIQSRSRRWHSWSGTYFVMAMLTIPGLIRLFPRSGSDCGNRLVDLGALSGDGDTRRLADDVTAALEPTRIASRLDRWLIARLGSSQGVPEIRHLSKAHHVLLAGGTVAMAARSAQTNRRQLHRWFHRHLGIGPKDLADVARVGRSLHSLQTRSGDCVSGYSDQAHQIRQWRRRLGITPGSYQRDPPSPMATYFSSRKSAGPSFYL